MLTSGEAGWFKADERWPEELTTVLVYTSAGNLKLGTVHNGRWEIDFPRWDSADGEELIGADVLFWTFLPHPPHDLL